MEEDNLKRSAITESTHLLSKPSGRKRREATKCRKAVVFVCCIVQNLVAYGVGFGLSVMYAELVVVFDVLRANAALIQSLNTGLATSGGIVFVGVIRKIGPGMCMVVGGILGSAGLFVSAFADGLTLIIICTGVVTGVAFSVCILTSFLVTGLMFKDNASFFLIFLTAGYALGQFIYPLLFDLFISQYAWSGAFMLIAAVSLHTVPCGIVVHFSKPYYDPEGTLQQTKGASVCDPIILKDIVIWLVMVNTGLFFLTASMEPWFMVDIMVSRGFSRKSGSILVSVVGLGSFAGRFVGALLRHVFRFQTCYHWIYMFVIIAGLHSVIINLTDFRILVFVCFVYGISFAIAGSQGPAVTFEASGVDRYVQAMAFVNVSSGIGDVIGPLFGGYIKDTFGEYNITFYTASGLSIYMSLASVAIVCIQRRRTVRAGTGLIEAEEQQLIKK